MCNFFDACLGFMRSKADLAGRRGRKSCAEDAKGIPKDIQIGQFMEKKHIVTVIWSYVAIKIILLKNTHSNKFKINICSKPSLFQSKLDPISVFFRYSFASSAQLLRPLRPVVWFSALALSLVAAQTAAQTSFQGIGRPATPAEIKSWDIDVRPDFKGLPKGQGSVQQGEQIWDGKCASCHGSFGENNEVFTPLVGFTSKNDVETGRVASLQLGNDAPTRTSMMKVSQLSTLWDYINRAMPWTAPKSLSADEVYAVTAYMLNLAQVVPDSFTLSDQNMAQTQARIPNRLGITTAHSMWPGKEHGGSSKPDVQGSTCMKNCATQVRVVSFIPDYARNAHGNLAEQSRMLGGSRGAQTVRVDNSSAPTNTAAVKITENTANVTAVASQPAPNSGANTVLNPSPQKSQLKMADVSAALGKHACMACHAVNTRVVGPSFKEIIAKQGAKPNAQAYLAGKIKSGGQGVYGAIPMPAQAISEADAVRIANWLLQGAAP